MNIESLWVYWLISHCNRNYIAEYVLYVYDVLVYKHKHTVCVQ